MMKKLIPGVHFHEEARLVLFNRIKCPSDALCPGRNQEKGDINAKTAGQVLAGRWKKTIEKAIIATSS